MMCANWMASDCVAVAGKTGFCESCLAMWVRYYVQKLGGMDGLLATTAETFQRELAWPADDPLGAMTLDQARELRLAIGRALSPVLALNSADFWGGLPRVGDGDLLVCGRVLSGVASRRLVLPLSAGLTWCAVLLGLALVCGLYVRWCAGPSATMQFQWSPEPPSVDALPVTAPVVLREVRL